MYAVFVRSCNLLVPCSDACMKTHIFHVTRTIGSGYICCVCLFMQPTGSIFSHMYEGAYVHVLLPSYLGVFPNLLPRHT